MKKDTLGNYLREQGMSRRSFLKFCSLLASGMAIAPAMVPKIASALEAARRPSVIWLSFQECTGCTESLTRSHSPTVEGLIFDTISSLLMYEQSNDIIKFTNDLSMERKHQEINKVFIVLKEQSILQEQNANFIKDVGMFMDKVIDVSESEDSGRTEA